MPEQPAILATWDNFDYGDYGKLGGERAPKGSFHAENMLVYSDGTIGPRAGLKDITPTDMPEGALLGFVASPVPERDGVFIIGTSVYYFDLFETGTAPTLLGNLDQLPEQPVVLKLDTGTLLLTNRWDDSGTSLPDGTYRINLGGAGSLDKITDAPGGIDVVLYGQQLIVAGSQFSPQILASSPTDPNDWSEGRFFDVGDNWQVTALHVIRNALTIVKRTGWYILQGVLGDASTERVTTVSTADGVLHAWECDRDQQDRIWFWTLFKRHSTPGYYDGTLPRQVAHMSLDEEVERDDTIAATPLKRGVVVLEGDMTPSTIVFVQGGTAQSGRVEHNGKWTRHQWETDISGLLGQGGPLSAQFLATDGGADGESAKIYTTLFNLDRPGFVSDGLSSPGDDSLTPLNASLVLPQWWSPGGREVDFSQLVVDFDSWDTGTTETNHFDVTVRVLGRDRAEEVTRDTLAGTPAPFDEAPVLSSTNGTRRRKTFKFSCPPGAGIEVSITNIRGCSFRSFTMMDAKREVRPI